MVANMAILTIYYTDGDCDRIHIKSAKQLAERLLHYRCMFVNHIEVINGVYIDSIDLNNEILFH